MKESFEIQNQDNFIEKLRNLGENSKIAKKVSVNRSEVANWLNRTHKPSSKNIKKILNEYGLEPEELGAGIKKSIVIDDNKKTGKIIEELKDEKKINQQTLAKNIGVGKGTISSWISGRNIPSDYYMQELSKFFGVSTSYLKGETESKKADNEEIGNRLGIDDIAIKRLEELKKIPKMTPLFGADKKTIDDIEELDIINLMIEKPDFSCKLTEGIKSIIIVNKKQKEYQSCAKEDVKIYKSDLEERFKLQIKRINEEMSQNKAKIKSQLHLELDKLVDSLVDDIEKKIEE